MLIFRTAIREILNKIVRVNLPRPILYSIQSHPAVRRLLKRIYWKTVSVQRRVNDSFNNQGSNESFDSRGRSSWEYERAIQINEHWTRPFSGRAPWIVFTTQDFPFWNRTGHFTRLERIVRIIQKLGYRVAIFPNNDLEKSRRFFSVTNEEMRSYQISMADAGIAVIPSSNQSDFLYRENSSISCFWFYGQSPAARFLKEYRGKFPMKRLVLDTIDLEYRRAEQFGDSKLANELKSMLHTLITYSDVVLMISEEELEYVFRDLESGYKFNSEMVVLSNIYPLARQGEILHEKKSTIEYDGIFVGTFLHEPNRKAVNWLLESILPRVARGKFLIVGEGLPNDYATLVAELNSEYENLTVDYFGHVPTLDDAYLSSKFALAPLKFGAGVKGKVIEALSYGLPVIGTEVAFEGIAEADGELLIGATNDEEFAREIERMMDSSVEIDRLMIFEQANQILSKFSETDAAWKIARILE